MTPQVLEDYKKSPLFEANLSLKKEAAKGLKACSYDEGRRPSTGKLVAYVAASVLFGGGAVVTASLTFIAAPVISLGALGFIVVPIGLAVVGVLCTAKVCHLLYYKLTTQSKATCDEWNKIFMDWQQGKWQDAQNKMDRIIGRLNAQPNETAIGYRLREQFYTFDPRMGFRTEIYADYLYTQTALLAYLAKQPSERQDKEAFLPTLNEYYRSIRCGYDVRNSHSELIDEVQSEYQPSLGTVICQEAILLVGLRDYTSMFRVSPDSNECGGAWGPEIQEAKKYMNVLNSCITVASVGQSAYDTFQKMKQAKHYGDFYRSTQELNRDELLERAFG